MKTKEKIPFRTTIYFYRWRYAAEFKLAYLIPAFSFGKNVQGATFNRSYSIKWINWELTIWHTLFDYQNNADNIHELNVKKYILS